MAAVVIVKPLSGEAGTVLVQHLHRGFDAVVELPACVMSTEKAVDVVVQAVRMRQPPGLEKKKSEGENKEELEKSDELEDDSEKLLSVADVMSLASLSVKFYDVNQNIIVQGPYLTTINVHYWSFDALDENDLVRLITQMPGSHGLESGRQHMMWIKSIPSSFSELGVPSTIANVMNYVIASSPLGHMARCRLMIGLLEMAKGTPTLDIIAKMRCHSGERSVAITTMKMLRAMTSEDSLSKDCRQYLNSLQ